MFPGPSRTAGLPAPPFRCRTQTLPCCVARLKTCPGSGLSPLVFVYIFAGCDSGLLGAREAGKTQFVSFDVCDREPLELAQSFGFPPTVADGFGDKGVYSFLLAAYLVHFSPVTSVAI